MGLALVIPVWNDHGALIRLLHGATRLGCFEEVVVIDDGSDRAVDPAALPRPAPLIVLRNARPQGAGQARNRGLDVVRASHLLFFDADDLLTPELPPLWQALQGRAYDFCLFRHADSRAAARGIWAEAPQDRGLWHLSGCGGAALSEVPVPARATLAETANYPWNKIYRTDFLRFHGIRCSETPVHNDITLHWLSFAHAGRMLASDRVAALHRVVPGGGRLTNRDGAERLCVLDVLEAVAPRLEGPLRMAFLRFASGLLDWVHHRIGPDHRPALERGMADFLRRHLDPPLMARLATRDPVLGLRLLLQMTAAPA